MSDVQHFSNLVDLITKSVARFADRPLFGTKTAGSWVYTSYREFGAQVDAFRAGLASMGVGEGDRVAVIADNRVEWAVAAYAVFGLGACYIPMYQKQNPKDWEFIISDCEAKVILTANTRIATIVRPFAERLERVEHIVDFEGSTSDPHSFVSLLAAGKDTPWPAISPGTDDLACFIYTSGTTGNPKGVMLTHGNLTSNINGVQQIFPMRQGDRSLSFLPWAHSFGQTVELHTLISFGASMAIAESVEKLIGNLSEVRPTLLFAVPRIFNRIYDGLNKKMAEAGGLKKTLFDGAMANAKVRRTLAADGRSSLVVNAKHAISDRLVFSKVRDRLGGRLRYAFSGGAAISKEVAEFIDNVGITVYEGYGLSETSPICTANYPENRRIGSVGKALPGVEVAIDTEAIEHDMGDQGEVIVRGPNIMKGYHNLPEQTAAAIRADGFFRTGDIGRLDSEGFLYITGRIKEQYKLENGKYVVPAPLEEQLKLSGYIDQVMIYGMNRPHNIAVVVPDIEALTKWATAQGLPGNVDALLKNAQVQNLYTDEIARYAQEVFKGFERVRAFQLISEPFSTDNEMLTPTLKLKRRNVLKAYGDVVERLYKP